MKTKPFLLILFVFIYIIQINAQIPTLTFSNSGIQPGDIFSYYEADTVGVEPGSAGTNQIWNFSDLTMNSVLRSTHFISPSITQNHSLFVEATVADTSGGNEAFYKINSNENTVLGWCNSSTNIVYTNPETIVNYPFSYGDISNDNFSANYNASSIQFYTNGTVSANADSWGTLILPSGTFSNILRVKFIQDVTDSSTFYTALTHTETYSWYDGVNKRPIFDIVKTVSSAMGNTYYVKTVHVSADVYSGLNYEENKGLTFYMLLDNDKKILNLYFNSQIESDAELFIYDMQGKMVKNSKIGFVQKGNSQKAIGLPEISKGIYIVKLKTDKNYYNKKIVLN